MKPALVISGAIITALARPRLRCNQAMSGSFLKFANVNVAAVTSER